VARDRKAAAKEAGINFIHLPFNAAAPDPMLVDNFLKAVTDPRNQPAFIHCASANRAAALWMIKRVERQVQFWFTPRGGTDPNRVGQFPIFIWEMAGGRQFYGLPARTGDEVKVAFVRGGPSCTPDTIDRTVRPAEVAAIADVLGQRIPSMSGTFLRASTCMYTNTADEHFVIANHPERQNVVVACGFSGHGFKFVPVVAEILADLAIDGVTRHPIDLFNPARFR